MFLSLYLVYLLLCMLHFLPCFFITELYFCSYSSASCLLTFQFSEGALFQEKKKFCFNLNFTGFLTQTRSYFWYKPLSALFSFLREKHWPLSPVEPLNMFRLTFTSGGEESKSSATDFMQMLFDTCLFLKGSLLYSLAPSLKTSRTPAWVSLQQLC